MTYTGELINVEPLPDDLLSTKLFRPAPRQSLVHRPRLAMRLTEGLTVPLTIMVAPLESESGPE